MRDIYRELLRRSVEDAASIAITVNEDDNGVQVGGGFIAQGSMALFNRRVNHRLMQYEESKMKEMAPDLPEDPNRGSY